MNAGKSQASDLLDKMLSPTRTTQVLDRPNTRRDLCPTKVDAFKAVPVVGSRRYRLFDRIGMNHEGKRFLDVFFGRASVEAANGFSRVIQAALSYLPPW